MNQVYKQYILTEQIPETGKANGRPARPIENWEIQMVKEAFEEYSVSASMLMKLIERGCRKEIING